MTNMLLVDIGNSRIKWALSQDGMITVQGNHSHEEVTRFSEALDKLVALDRIIACNVAGEKGERALGAAIKRWKIAPEWFQVSKHAGGVTNCYETPERLGADRWAALIAAHSMRLGACLVISLGTAMTIDWLHASGEFAGGMIIPGKRLMSEALSIGTSKIARQTGKVVGFSCNTADAVESGLAYALVGAVKQARQKVMDTSGVIPACLITGGDGAWLAAMLDFPVTNVPDLVIKGLALMAAKNK
jgi:type III pantothenate kinase